MPQHGWQARTETEFNLVTVIQTNISITQEDNAKWLWVQTKALTDSEKNHKLLYKWYIDNRTVLLPVEGVSMLMRWRFQSVQSESSLARLG